MIYWKINGAVEIYKLGTRWAVLIVFSGTFFPLKQLSLCNAMIYWKIKLMHLSSKDPLYNAWLYVVVYTISSSDIATLKLIF